MQGDYDCHNRKWSHKTFKPSCVTPYICISRNTKNYSEIPTSFFLGVSVRVITVTTAISLVCCTAVSPHHDGGVPSACRYHMAVIGCPFHVGDMGTVTGILLEFGVLALEVN